MSRYLTFHNSSQIYIYLFICTFGKVLKTNFKIRQREKVVSNTGNVLMQVFPFKGLAGNYCHILVSQMLPSVANTQLLNLLSAASLRFPLKSN